MKKSKMQKVKEQFLKLPIEQKIAFLRELSAMLDQLEQASDKELLARCSYDPVHEPGQGMYHCPVCGEMVIHGLPHYSDKKGESSAK